MTTSDGQPDSKRCSECGVEKPLTEFYRDASTADGHKSACKTCAAERKRQPHVVEANREYSRRYYHAHKEEKRAYQQQYEADHREERQEYNRRWREAHPEYERQWRETNRDAVNENHRRWRAANPESDLASQRRYKEANRETLLEHGRQYREANRKALNERNRQLRKSYREKVLKYYSLTSPPSCACPGCDATDGLTIDHVNGDGAKHRQDARAASHSTNFYRWLIEQDFPPGYQILCKSCNSSKGTGTHCLIHEQEHPT